MIKCDLFIIRQYTFGRENILEHINKYIILGSNIYIYIYVCVPGAQKQSFAGVYL